MYSIKNTKKYQLNHKTLNLIIINIWSCTFFEMKIIRILCILNLKKKKRNKNKNIFNRKLFNGVKIGTTQKSPNYGLHNQTL